MFTVQEASKQEIIRRYFQTECDFKKGLIDEEAVNRIKLIMEEVGLRPEDRNVSYLNIVSLLQHNI
ncbi:hypothetical protein EfmAA290_13970 [Enterococcus faecium]|nr:hypothetical protein EfmAA290_13970 [Enterococcus faecium]